MREADLPKPVTDGEAIAVLKGWGIDLSEKSVGPRPSDKPGNLEKGAVEEAQQPPQGKKSRSSPHPALEMGRI